MKRAHLEEKIFKGLMRGAFVFVAFGLVMILLTVIVKGLQLD